MIVTVLCIVIANVVVAQVLIQWLYPGAGVRMGRAVLIALGVVVIASAVYAAQGWRAYFRSEANRRS